MLLQSDLKYLIDCLSENLLTFRNYNIGNTSINLIFVNLNTCSTKSGMYLHKTEL